MRQSTMQVMVAFVIITVFISGILSIPTKQLESFIFTYTDEKDSRVDLQDLQLSGNDYEIHLFPLKENQDKCRQGAYKLSYFDVLIRMLKSLITSTPMDIDVRAWNKQVNTNCMYTIKGWRQAIYGDLGDKIPERKASTDLIRGKPRDWIRLVQQVQIDSSGNKIPPTFANPRDSLLLDVFPNTYKNKDGKEFYVATLAVQDLQGVYQTLCQGQNETYTTPHNLSDILLEYTLTGNGGTTRLVRHGSTYKLSSYESVSFVSQYFNESSDGSQLLTKPVTKKVIRYMKTICGSSERMPMDSNVVISFNTITIPTTRTPLGFLLGGPMSISKSKGTITSRIEQYIKDITADVNKIKEIEKQGPRSYAWRYLSSYKKTLETRLAQYKVWMIDLQSVVTWELSISRTLADVVNEAISNKQMEISFVDNKAPEPIVSAEREAIVFTENTSFTGLKEHVVYINLSS